MTNPDFVNLQVVVVMIKENIVGNRKYIFWQDCWRKFVYFLQSA